MALAAPAAAAAAIVDARDRDRGARNKTLLRAARRGDAVMLPHTVVGPSAGLLGATSNLGARGQCGCGGVHATLQMTLARACCTHYCDVCLLAALADTNDGTGIGIAPGTLNGSIALSVGIVNWRTTLRWWF